YPYEVQIMDYDHYLASMSGPASHDQYKTRQRAKARERLFGSYNL
ncbi:TIGR04552 family protein, partial [bacterium]|nr:TIGR04552 family protein [bacterium]